MRLALNVKLDFYLIFCYNIIIMGVFFMREIGSRPVYYKIRSPLLYLAIVLYEAVGLQVIKNVFFDIILKNFSFIKSILS